MGSAIAALKVKRQESQDKVAFATRGAPVKLVDGARENLTGCKLREWDDFFQAIPDGRGGSATRKVYDLTIFSFDKAYALASDKWFAKTDLNLLQSQHLSEEQFHAVPRTTPSIHAGLVCFFFWSEGEKGPCTMSFIYPRAH